MKKLFIQLLLAVLPFTLAAQEKGMQFEKGTFAEALAKAKKENKNVFVDCYTQWCGPCRFMTSNVFNTDSVGDYMNQRYISIKIDMEHGEGPELNKTFNVKAYPTYLLFTPEGKELGRFDGAMPGQTFINSVGLAAEGKDVRAIQKAEREKQAKGAVDTNAAGTQAKDTIYDEGKGIEFLEITYAQALEKAKAENKRVFIDCYTSWCAPCKKMLATTFRDTRIGNLMNHQFVTLKVNMEEEGDGKMLSEKFNVRAFPTYLLINSDGTEYNRFLASGTVFQFANNLTKALLGEEDAYVKQEREMKEAIDKMRQERKNNLTQTPKTFKTNLVKFEKDGDLDKAVKKAKKQNKKVFAMLCTSDWQTDYMLETVFNEKEAADYLNKGYVCVLVDAESVPGDKIADKYDLGEMFPGYVILDGEGQMKTMMFGIRKHSDIFIQSIEQSLNRSH